MDTQWWLQESKDSENCTNNNPDKVVDALKHLISSAKGKFVMVVAHHPLATEGPHGGFQDWKAHLFPLTQYEDWMWLPLPVIGSIYALGRKLFGHAQDINNDLNRSMVGQLKKVLQDTGADARPLVFAAGHEHSLQVFQGELPNTFYLVSGAGSSGKITPVYHDKHTLFAHSHAGLMIVDVMNNLDVLLRVVEPGNKSLLNQWLYKTAGDEPTVTGD